MFNTLFGVIVQAFIFLIQFCVELLEVSVIFKVVYKKHRTTKMIEKVIKFYSFFLEKCDQ